jgi:diadenosine tetraphosphate (Ap4A) HIT family hydrolase
VAAIGNIVRQMHVHVVGRNTNDFCWPNVVWGTREKTPYSAEDLKTLSAALEDALPNGAFLPIRA